MKRLFLSLVLVLCSHAITGSALSAFDHQHRAWSDLLKKHVVLKEGGKTSQVRYAGFAADRQTLKSYLDSLSAVPELEFKAWTRDQQLAFLINAYNAFTVEKILTRYPKLNSIRDFGTVFGNPWKDRFFTLLGKPQHLDGIEHETIRAPGVYDDPRVHFAVNCASVGCPMLREEAFVAGRLDKQLEEQTLRFMSDRSRNLYSAQSGKLEVSSIFKWYGEDFARGWKGFASLDQFMAKYAERLTDKPEEQSIVRERKAKIEFLDYDWSLNVAR